ncbi:peptidase M12 [Pseudomonas entomophila]|uniref:peptidase M12 n=1 Tax=Pseudomonas entomophila TaxID=312306 RepID=UPI0024072FE3|nr:peptidase M12 [Pseudomonas entomophila]MDF9616101.1 peptidase M12 [Pseudomonas entomophila]
MSDVLMASATYRLRQKLLLPQSAKPRRKRSVADHSVFWRPGQTLRISFIGTPCPWLEKAIFDTACQWLKYANLTFERLGNDADEAEIRIQTDVQEDVNYSFLGNQALDVEGATMVLGVKLSDPLFEPVVLHEFGHALGMEHEHQHPQANIPWDLDRVRQLLATTLADEANNPDHLDDLIEEDLATQFLPLPDNDDLLILPYDRQSIMHYRIRQKLTHHDFKTSQNLKISKKDKRFMRLVYPASCKQHG